MAATTVMATVAGFVISSVAATGTVVAVPIMVGAIAGCILVGVGAAFMRGRRTQLPDSLIDDASVDGVYKCGFSTEERLREAVELTKSSYEHEYVEPEVAVQWLMKNRHGFVEILNSHGELCASFGILGLSKSFAEQFVAGKVTDTQLRAENILTLEEARRSDSLYISGVVVRDSERHRGSKRAWVMLWCMLHYMKKVYGLRRTRRLYAVALNRRSETLMKHFGFRLLCSKEGRVDRCPLYEFTLTKDTWAELIQRVGDFSPMCQCDFSIPGRGRVTVRPSPETAARSRRSSPPKAALDGDYERFRLLFIAGDRGGSQRNQIQTPKEFESLEEALGGSKHRGSFVVVTPIQAVTIAKLAGAYRDRPAILHFAGHGDDRKLSLILDQAPLASETPVVPEQLVRILGSFPDRIRLCVLNTCNSATIAERLVEAGVADTAVGWPGKLPDASAIAFTQTFYRCLGNGLTISQSTTLALEACHSDEPGFLFVRDGVDKNTNPFVPKDDK